MAPRTHFALPTALGFEAERRGGGRCEKRETHISHVRLSGAVALKACKPVDFGFVDLSTPEKRRAALEKELAVNDRFAPYVYRRVFDLPGCEPEGVREPALEMARLPEFAALGTLVGGGNNSHRAIHDGLGRVLDHLLPLFEASERGPEVARWGDPAVIRRNLTENLDVLDAAEAEHGLNLGAAALRGRQLTLLALCEPELRERAAAGFVRDGHGDLRCEHLYLMPDGVKALDAIAFADRLRCVDVADEIAFLSQDLVRCDFQFDLGTDTEWDFANWLLKEYCRRTGDPVSDRLLMFYRSYRWAVRAKVAALAGPPWETTPGYGNKLIEVLTDYARLDCGWALSGDWDAEVEPGPVLILVGGLSGSGKSTLAAAVADRLGAVHLRSDIVRKDLLGVPHDRPAPAGAYSDETTERVYAALAEAVGDPRRVGGGTAVVDATFLRPADRRQFAALGDEPGGPQPWVTLFVWCECDGEVAAARLAARAAEGTDASDADLAVRRRQAVGLGRGDFREFPHVLRLDTDAPVDELCDRVIHALRVAAGVRGQ